MPRFAWMVGVLMGLFVAACGGTSQVDAGSPGGNANLAGSGGAGGLSGGGAGSAGAGAAPGASSIWGESSSEIVIEHFTYGYSVVTHESTSSYDCRRWPRASMSQEQLAYLSALEPHEGQLRGVCDGGWGTTVTVVESNSTWQELKTDDSAGPCSSPVLEARLLPAAIAEKFPEAGSSPCVECNAALPCAEGTCIKGTCAN